MTVIKMPLSSLKKPERNVRIHTERQLKEYERSISMFGQIRPLVVDETHTILAGVGCYETLLRMGREEADVYLVEHLTPNQKKKLMIADNKLSGLGIDDMETFNAFLEDLKEDLDIPGFDEEILQSMVAEADDISDTLSTYGTIDTEDIAGIQAAKERKEAAMSREVAPQEHPGQSLGGPPAPDTTQEDTTTADVRKFVVCPHCGEKIWL